MQRILTVFGSLAVFCSCHGALAAPSESVIYGFQGGTDAYFPQTGLVLGKSGVLYGVTSYGGANGKGAVFALTPPASAGGTWTERVIHSFSGGATDGAAPSGRLLFDAATGSLFGTTTGGGSAGNVFKLTPPAKAGDAWKVAVLYTFKGNTDGANPIAGLTRGKDGTLYGTTYNGGAGAKGTVFALLPPTPTKPKWTEKVLATFRGQPDGAAPNGGVVLDAAGNLYGTTLGGGASGQGTVYRLAPPASASGSWTKKLLYSFKTGSDGQLPQGELVIGANGVLYGTATSGGGLGGGTGYGAVFKLAPGATATAPWTETVIYRFKGGTDGAGPQAGLLRDTTGALYGVTSKTAFKLTPSGATWTESVLHLFGTSPDGNAPWCTPIKGADGALYGTTFAGGSKGMGTVFRLVP